MDALLLGLFHEATPVAETVAGLRELGVPDDHIQVLSGVPYLPAMLGRKHAYQRLVPIALSGAAVGLIGALFLVVGTPLLYPVQVGGQSIVPVPPSIIIVFELTMLGTLVATLGGLLAELRFPIMGHRGYDSRVTEGHIGVLVQVPDAQVARAEGLLKAGGAHHFSRFDREEHPGVRYWLRWAYLGMLVLIPGTLLMLLAYAVFSLPIPNQMVEQPSVAYEMGPRKAAPAEAVPVQGPALVNGQPFTAPLPATAGSLQRGDVLFHLMCAMCHGQQGKGDGTLAGYFNPRPADLTGNKAQSLSDAGLFRVITLGQGPMPPQAENLLPNERWDVVNYVRTLKAQ
jgi:mono/diheme cytochrome c family protein